MNLTCTVGCFRNLTLTNFHPNLNLNLNPNLNKWSNLVVRSESGQVTETPCAVIITQIIQDNTVLEPWILYLYMTPGT